MRRWPQHLSSVLHYPCNYLLKQSNKPKDWLPTTKLTTNGSEDDTDVTNTQVIIPTHICREASNTILLATGLQDSVLIGGR